MDSDSSSNDHIRAHQEIFGKGLALLNPYGCQKQTSGVVLSLTVMTLCFSYNYCIRSDYTTVTIIQHGVDSQSVNV